MPVFTFEKISPEKMSPPATPGPVSEASEPRPRGAIAQIFSRFSEARDRRKIQRKTRGVIARNDAFQNPAQD
ncbi:MAG: hypothetical protein JSS22_23340 [Proteobacteria bacterium]|nr:hypothetical protein [Pseudomonadota bacterium]